MLKQLFLPPSGIFLLYFVACCMRGRQRRIGMLLMHAAIAIFFVLCSGWFSQLLSASLERLTTPVSVSDLKQAQAIVVLAAGRVPDAPEYNGQSSPDYIALARLRYAARLHRDTGLPILVSGGSIGSEASAETLGHAMERSLRQDFGVPVRWVEQSSRNSRENAVFSAKLLCQDGIQRILLVTDAMHMHRAAMAFAGTGMVAIEAPTMFLSTASLGVHSFIPSVEALRRSYYALYQWLGIAWYRMQPWMQGRQSALACSSGKAA